MITVTNNYPKDLKAAIAHELFTPNAKPKKADLIAAIEDYNAKQLEGRDAISTEPEAVAVASEATEQVTELAIPAVIDQNLKKVLEPDVLESTESEKQLNDEMAAFLNKKHEEAYGDAKPKAKAKKSAPKKEWSTQDDEILRKACEAGKADRFNRAKFILELVERGQSIKEIASRMGLSTSKVQRESKAMQVYNLSQIVKQLYADQQLSWAAIHDELAIKSIKDTSVEQFDKLAAEVAGRRKRKSKLNQSNEIQSA